MRWSVGTPRSLPRLALWWVRARRNHFIRDGGANGRHNEVNTDGCVDSDDVCQQIWPCISIFSLEPSLNNARYGLRGVRVGEASNPGPQSCLLQSRVRDTVGFFRRRIFVAPCGGATCGPEGRVHSSTDSGRLHNICRFSTDSGRFSTTSVDGLV